MKTTASENAKRTATAKIKAWADVQSKAHNKKVASRQSGNATLADLYFKAEVKASCRRARHEGALVAIDKAEREAAEVAAWEARKAR